MADRIGVAMVHLPTIKPPNRKELPREKGTTPGDDQRFAGGGICHQLEEVGMNDVNNPRANVVADVSTAVGDTSISADIMARDLCGWCRSCRLFFDPPDIGGRARFGLGIALGAGAR